MRVSRVASELRGHPRLRVAVELTLLAIFLGLLTWGVRGSLHAAGRDLRNANPGLFVLACAAVAAYYLVFVIGWIRILSDWGVRISYPTSLQAEIISMLAKYVPGGVWTPAARVVAMRRAGVTDASLVTAAMLVEAGLSAVSGVLVFAISLAWVHGVSGPVIPIGIFGIVVAVLLYPRIFQALAARFLRRLGYEELPPLRPSTLVSLLLFYAGTWVIGGAGLWLLLRSVGAHPAASTIVFLGGTAAVGAIVAVLAFFAPSGLGAREGSMYGLMLAVVAPGAALSATLLNRVAITVVEVLLFLIGSLVLRQVERRGSRAASRVSAAGEPAPRP
ncbi:MAG: flippase-like domain-containing protein [Acidobacteriota bacterium]|nr:flippase-like domain-containing protein [Acidobacteriota bacterium]MDE3189515.1 flippase-like domain-containing protein [Acidobacteriota bacterium]